tara:strand:+ start:696 stop:1046 length:351 start_codon:yes stop_codon:yes gene_type:complete
MDGVPIWLELKIIKNGIVKVSKSQIAWHCSHSHCNGTSFFLLHDPFTSDLFLFDGASVIEIHGSRIDDLRPAACALICRITIRKRIPSDRVAGHLRGNQIKIHSSNILEVRRRLDQ